jgi:hypothetical protein
MSSNTLGPLVLMAPKFAQHVSFFIFFKDIKQTSHSCTSISCIALKSTSEIKYKPSSRFNNFL